MPRILVIEDDDVTAREIAAELTSHGIDVDRIADGSEGLLRAADPCYDAITLDMMLPGMDGLSVVTQLRALGVATPVLMISALCDVDEARARPARRWRRLSDQTVCTRRNAGAGRSAVAPAPPAIPADRAVGGGP